MAKAERRNVWKQIGATLQTAWRYDRMAVLSVVVLSVLDAVTPYVAILLSAYILDGLAAGRTLGAVVKYATTLYQLTSRFADLTSAFGEFAVTAGRQQSTLAYIHVPDSLYKGTLPVEKRADNEYELAFHDVSFKYPGSERYALRHLSMQLRVGERLAVVGQNGSGKTTMIKLLCRLYDPTEGVITLNGIDIRKYDYAEYQSIFSVVFQDFRLFSFPLAQNVAASADFDTERVLDSLEKAGFAERLAAMPQGLETPLYRDYSEDGVEISGGEAQKLALARALYKDAPFIVLDEPTAALDPVAEYEIYAAFDRIVGDKTTVYISHRLASCRFCDDIAVFDEGMLVQRGNHAALLEQEGKYRALWNAQAQYYTEQGTESPRTDRSATPAV